MCLILILSLFLFAAVFNKVHQGKFYFSLQNVAHEQLFLALCNNSQFTVRGMVSVSITPYTLCKYYTHTKHTQSGKKDNRLCLYTKTSHFQRKQDMRDESDSFWRYLFFSAIGDSDNGDIVLQYYGNRFGPDPDKAPYYLVIEMTRDRVPVFRIANQKVAKYCGRLGIIEH